MLEKSAPSGKIHAFQGRRWILGFCLSHKILILVIWTFAFASWIWWRVSCVDDIGFTIAPQTPSPPPHRPPPPLSPPPHRQQPQPQPQPQPPPPPPPLRQIRMGQMFRPVVFNLSDFGAVGDGRTLNTESFERAVAAIAELGERGGGQLDVPAGVWLTAPFNLTSHMTLFLAEGAVILGVEDERYWPLMPPLPSYGYGREHKGSRYGSLIHGQKLKDVVITGHNGTINGQGQIWWTKFQNKLLNHTRGPLLQLMWSKDIVISNITLRDSPFWTVHPYDCKNVTISNVTILAPLSGAPNTDGIDPDSCEDVVIENCYIRTGDDGIAIKSGWDQYGIAYGRPSTNISIRNVSVRSVVSAGVSIGSEMSGGVSNVTVENLYVWGSKRGIRIKTAPGRGGYVHNITYRNVILNNVEVGITIRTDYNEHPDGFFNPKDLPTLNNICFRWIYGQDVRVPVRIDGSQEIPVKNISFRDMSVGLRYKKKTTFLCSFVQGQVIGTIFPEPCENLDRYDTRGRPAKRPRSRPRKKRSLGNQSRDVSSLYLS